MTIHDSAKGSLASQFGVTIADPDSKSSADVPTGSLSDIKDLYKGPEDASGQAQWLDKYPEDAEEAAENEETDKFALLARKRKCYSGRKKFDLDSIVVHSPFLKVALAKVFDGYPGVTCSLDRLEFENPFEPFVHRWGRFQAVIKEETDVKTSEHLELLRKLLAEELKDTIKALEDYIVNGITTFTDLWTIFQPGSLVFTRARGAVCCMKFYSGSYQKTDCGEAFNLCLEPVDWDGSKFGKATRWINIFKFSGTKPIKDLHTLPLAFHAEHDMIRKTLLERGKKFEALAGYHYKAYDGVAMAWNSKDKPIPVRVEGRIIIDTEAFERFNPDKSIDVEDLAEDDFYIEEIAGKPASSLPLFSEQIRVDDEEPKMRLKEEALLCCSPSVPGYSLKLKRWLYFYVDFVKEIIWNDNAFSTLQLPADQKDLVLSFTESQVANKEAFDDVIQGKGKGIIMLLSGPPGVGKTLTAESVAETMHIPLYMMSAGDLGIRPDEVEDALQNILEMVSKWNAILLLDECDVFLEARTVADLERNKLVSIFLRTLEYYQGILFLTTNRVGNMDAAFQSRIHVSMEYPDLSMASRRQIWKNFLSMGKEVSGITEADLDVLAEVDLNGRQIKNVLKTAFLLSARKKVPLAREHVETVLSIEGTRPKLG